MSEMSLGIVTLFWLNLEAKSMTIKLLILNLEEDSVSSGQSFELRLHFIIWVRNHFEVKSIWVPGVGCVVALCHKSMDLGWSIDRGINFDRSSERSWGLAGSLLH